MNCKVMGCKEPAKHRLVIGEVIDATICQLHANLLARQIEE